MTRTMTDRGPGIGRANGRARLLLVIGGICLLAFAGVAVAGTADLPPFALAFVAAAIPVVIQARAGSRWDAKLDWKIALEALAVLALGGALFVGAVRIMADPASWGGSISLVLGFLSGSFITDGLLRRQRGAAEQ